VSLLYTVIPAETIFQEDLGRRQSLWRHRGRMMYVEEDQLGSALVVRLLSTDPKDHLDPTLRPGARIVAGSDTERVEGPREAARQIP